MPTDDQFNAIYLELLALRQQVEVERKFRLQAEADTREICRTNAEVLKALAAQHVEHIKFIRRDR